jgi:hypothetical protein
MTMIKTYSVAERRALLADDLGGIGASLKPPKWLKKMAQKVVAKIPKGTTVQVSNPAGGPPIAVDLSDPASINKFKKDVAAMKLTIGPGPAPEPTVTSVATPVPGMASMPWPLIVGAAVVGFMLVKGGKLK